MKLISADEALSFANYKNTRLPCLSNIDTIARDIVIESMDGSLSYGSHVMDLSDCVECRNILVGEGYRVDILASDERHYLEIHWGS